MAPVRILHCHSTFTLGGKEARAVRLMNAFGDRAAHTVISSIPDALSARDAIDPAISVDFPGDCAPPLHGKPSPGRYRDLARYMAGFDLVLSYNWGAMDSVGARRLFPRGCPPLVHHEDGFNSDEIERLNWKRNGYRRLMLPAAAKLVVPSETLEAIARNVWKQPVGRVVRIPNGIAVDRYGETSADAFEIGLVRQPGDVVVGTIAGLRPVKNLPRLVRAVAAAGANLRLVIVGEGSARAAIEAEAARLDIADRVHLPGFHPAPSRIIGLFDIFALSSDSEQFPISMLEAMAASRPVVATDVGDVRAMLPAANRTMIVAPADEAGFAAALEKLASNPNLRQRIGETNRQHAQANYDETVMIDRYTALYSELAGQSLI